jgi:transposase
MNKCSTEMVIGMDISDKKSEICEMNYSNGKINTRTDVANDGESLSAFFSQYPDPEKVMVAMEAGTHSPWISALLSDMGFNVIIGNPRKLKFIWKSEKKSDRRDAEMLARIARFDTELFYPISHRSRESQSVLAVIKARDALVKTRTLLINSVRGMLKSMGYRPPSCSAPAFAGRIIKEMPEEYSYALKETLEIIGQITQSIKGYDKKLKHLCKEKYPEAEILQQVNGVGPITSLAFILTLEEPERFKKSRYVGCFLGLVPRRDQSGEIDKQLGITKAGNAYLRSLLVQCSQYIMGAFGDDCELRRFGEKLAARGGKAAKKRAIIAVARKLSILLHRLWADNATYEPFYLKNKRTLKKAA